MERLHKAVARGQPFQLGDIVILDNLSVHKSAEAGAAVGACGTRIL